MSDSQQVTAGEPLKVALLGCGVVGSSVARMLTEHAEETGSPVAAALVDQLDRFTKVMPRDYKRVLAELDSQDLQTAGK